MVIAENSAVEDKILSKERNMKIILPWRAKLCVREFVQFRNEKGMVAQRVYREQAGGESPLTHLKALRECRAQGGSYFLRLF